MDEAQRAFLEECRQSWQSGDFKKILLRRPSAGEEALGVLFRAVEIGGQRKLTQISDYPTRQITKNFDFDDGMRQLASLLKSRFRRAHLFAGQWELSLAYSKRDKVKLDRVAAQYIPECSLSHDHVKKRILDIDDSPFLRELGFMTAANQVASHMQRKFKQISRYLETVDFLIKSSDLMQKDRLSVTDMGSGKGYLTFAVYEYLVRQLGKTATVTGIDVRTDLIDFCNEASRRCGFEGLRFFEGDIRSCVIGEVDVLIALHACDTATDDAIFKGIRSGASIIITAPCCHKQIRKEMSANNALRDILHHGILAERQAEIVTDTLRALVMEAHGYKTNVFEFIADAHTHKNVMITAVKKSGETKPVFLHKIKDLKQLFGIAHFYLEDLLEPLTGP